MSRRISTPARLGGEPSPGQRRAEPQPGRLRVEAACAKTLVTAPEVCLCRTSPCGYPFTPSTIGWGQHNHEKPLVRERATSLVTDLLSLAQGYLGAEGWDVKARGRDLLRGDRDSRRGDDEKDYIYVWIPPDVLGGFSSREGPYIRRFEEATEQHPTAEKILLVPTLEGLSSEFRVGARRWNGVKILVPAQFFDSDFKWERDGRAASATSELRTRGAETARRRITQPFHLIRGPGANGTEEEMDLLATLSSRLRSPSGNRDAATIHIVVGPAGMGKSFLFESLYSHLYETFQANKRILRLSARPFALLPDHLYDASAPTIGSILDAYLRTEFARPMDRDMFNWKLVHGLGIWLLDGLDEILERDPQFFDHLEDLMTMPFADTPPSIVICVRDSLFSTHRGLREFCDTFERQLFVYQLNGWRKSSKHEYARRKLGSSSAATRFVQLLAENPALDELASTPYYCDLLVEEFIADRFGESSSEVEILESGIKRIILRERDKGLLHGISDQDIRAVIEECAAMSLYEGGIAVDETRELARLVVPEPDGEEEVNRLVTQMGQIAVFAHGYDGRLRFAQEALEHYLLSNHLVKSLQSTAKDLGRQELPDNVIRLMGVMITSSQDEDVIWSLLSDKLREDSIAGRNALRLAIKVSAGTERLANSQLAGLNLSGVRFDGHVLRSVSFDGSDLTNTDFRGADLTGASFDNCLIKGTVFDDRQAMLSSAHFGEMHKYYSSHVGNEFLDTVGKFRALIEGPGLEAKTEPACDAARQLRHLFGKFVEETGRGRRKDLPKRALLRGVQIVSNRDEILEEAIRARYLIEVPNREKISRAQDESYSELVRFRTDLQMSPGIRALLDDTCKDAVCAHVR